MLTSVASIPLPIAGVRDSPGAQAMLAERRCPQAKILWPLILFRGSFPLSLGQRL